MNGTPEHKTSKGFLVHCCACSGRHVTMLQSLFVRDDPEFGAIVKTKLVCEDCGESVEQESPEFTRQNAKPALQLVN